jgi:GTP-binding protein YchF
MKAGIVGFPGAGRRTLFGLLTRTAETVSEHKAHIGVLKITDPTLEEVARIQGSRKVTPATIEFVLIPGLVKGESKERLDLPSLRNVEVLVHVVRAFDDPTVPHPEGTVNPARDIEIVQLELALADLAVVEKRIERLQTDDKKGKKPDLTEKALLWRAKDALDAETPLRTILSDEERKNLRGYALLTAKPCLMIINVAEDRAAEDQTEELGLKRWAEAPATRTCYVSARIEAEIADLPPEDARDFREDLGLGEGTVERIVRETFELMGMITFYTAEEKEARAWIIPRGSRAVSAAGTVHSDMERGFIRAEVVSADVLVAEGSWHACRDKGLLRLEGKEYPVADGDVIYFRFHV